MKAMIGFHKALLAMPMPWPLWVAGMAAVNLVGAVVYLGTIEGKLVLAALMLGLVVQTAIYARLGFVRLLGIGHIAWLALVPWLVIRLAETGITGAFAYWLVAVIVVDGVSLVIDVVDVTRYLRGERAPTLPVPADGG